ncbi:hypothetical protein ACIQC9_06645 [Brevundimonas sp. NPDC092305]|uniref:hypothetical protein n=1 Tax=Brevundimonas sp. NPDC092305 TaxID=3363957 RepID=UPI00380952F2
MIQVDMFEVSLGAALLLQFETETGPVTVLADGGVTGYSSDKVLTKLPDAVESFKSGGTLHIDLLIGTHYDGDHLIGLPPIIRDKRITIGEAWLPPVANDTAGLVSGSRNRDGDYLAMQFAKPGKRRVLNDYLRQKADLIERLEMMERETSEVRGSILNSVWKAGRAPETKSPFPPSASIFSDAGRLKKGPALAWFKAHLKDSGDKTGTDGDACHADEDVQDLDSRPVQLGSLKALDRLDLMDVVQVDRDRVYFTDEEFDLAANRSLALIRKSEAKAAITAVHLFDVVEALTARGFDMRFATIPDGEPRRFVWKASRRRFIPSDRDRSDGPVLTLLGPSDGLVAKHRDRLPVGSYSAMLTKANLPLEGVTPSNQLSYVTRFDHAEQAILVTGDAGFVDFKPSRPRAPYHQRLLDCIKRLDVVQVAHHGGHNAHFYRCLVAAGFADQTEDAYLLLSHAVDDKHRPSEAFAKFIALAREDSRLKLLFTSRPLEAKVRDFLDLICPVAGGPAADRGDVRLVYDGSNWTVVEHRVEL